MRSSGLNLLLEKFAPPLILIVLLAYTYAELWQAPYIGFNFSSSTGEIGMVFVETTATSLAVGDRITQVNTVSWDEYVANVRQPLFPAVANGDRLTIHVVRAGKPLVVTWPIQQPTFTEVLDRAINVWWLGYIFWLSGTLTVLLIRPKDTRWRLLTAFYYCTAVWLVVGNTSRWYLWESPIILRVAIWLAVPIYLHLHWVFPRPLRKLPRWFWPSFYVAASVLVILQWVPLLPHTAYLFGFMTAILGSLVLLLCHWFLRPTERSAIRLLLWATSFAFLPAFGINLAHAYQALPWFGPIGLLGLIPIPAAYFYAVYRYQLGRLELRTNRLIALFLFTLLTATIILVVVSVSTSFVRFPGDIVLMSLIAVVATIITTVLTFPTFQHWIERHFLGIRTPLTQLLEHYASRIGTRLTLPDLTTLLRQEVLPTLMVRQSALIHRTRQQKWAVLYYDAVLPEQISLVDGEPLLNYMQYHVVHHADEAPAQWVRLALPLRLEGNVIGYWLLGRRDPDDFYSQSELTLFQALADQTAIALVNIEQAEQLRLLYQANVDRHEMERTHLAHALHDDVLNQMATLALAINGSEPTQAFDTSYSAVTTRVRQLITGLRPAMLAYGLGAALEELVDDLAERVEQSVRITCGISDSHIRLEPKIEQYLFRIVQQATENALRHAQAQQISITGTIAATQVVLRIEDDGIGLTTNNSLDLNTLLANKHFGIVGMYERANIIGATLAFDSQPGKGTCLTLSWSAVNEE